MKIEPVALLGRHVRLEPLGDEHRDGLVRAACHDELWRFMPFRIDDEQGASTWIAHVQDWVERQEGLVFATLDAATGEVIGSTGFLAAAPVHGRVEIGATWVTPGRQRTPVNTEAKYLMLTHAFETWRCLRVEFKTDALNERSRRALARIGATAEGVHRRHMRMPDGRIRDSAWFSVISEEWPDVKSRLESKLAGSA